MGPAATSLALLCLCSLGLCVPTGTASAPPAQVRRTVCVLFIAETCFVADVAVTVVCLLVWIEHCIHSQCYECMYVHVCNV